MSTTETIYTATSASVGSILFFIFALLFLSLIALLLVRHYLPLRSTPAYLSIPVFLALAIPSSIVLLVPIDLGSNGNYNDENGDARRYGGIWLPSRLLLVAWRISYWLTFVLTWVILPLLGDFVDSGYREPKDRLMYSLHTNMRYQLMVLGSGLLGLVYVIIQNGFEFQSMKGLVMALAYVWGLILAIYLMGHGLVALPRRLYRNADTAGRLRRLQASAPKTYDRLTDSTAALEDLEAQVSQLLTKKNSTGRMYQEWIDELADTAYLPESRGSTGVSTSNTKVPAVITDRYLADLSRKLNRARHQRARFVDTWDRLLREAIELQQILDSKTSKRLEFTSSSSISSFLTKSKLLTPYMRYQLHTRVMPWTRLLLAGILSILSVCIVFSEIIKLPAPQYDIISLTVSPPSQTSTTLSLPRQFIASIWLLYMCAAAFTSILEAKIWGNRALVPRNTYGESATWYAGQIARLTVPLSYNFLTFLPDKVAKDTVFYHFLGQLINLTPLGKWFDYVFPMLILLPVCATLFNFYGRVRRFFGLGSSQEWYANDDEESEGTSTASAWREGRALIEREINHHGISHSTSSTGLAGLNVPSNSSASSNPRSSPHLYVPPASASSRRSSPAPRPSRPHRPYSDNPNARTRDEDEEEDDNPLAVFAHRVRNTFATAEFTRPAWMGGPSSRDDAYRDPDRERSGRDEEGFLGLNFKKPKWMGGEDGVGRSNSGAPSGQGRGGNAGRIRL